MGVANDIQYGSYVALHSWMERRSRGAHMRDEPILETQAGLSRVHIEVVWCSVHTFSQPSQHEPR